VELTELRRLAERDARTEQKKISLEKLEREALVEELSIHQVALELQSQELAQLESDPEGERVFGASRAPMVAVDTENSITAINSAAEALFGYAANEVVGHALDLVLVEGDGTSPLEHREAIGLRKDGSAFATLLEVADCILHRKSARAVTVHDLALSIDFLQVCDRTESAFVVVDPLAGLILHVSSNFERIYGRARTEAVDLLGALTWIHPEDRDLVSRAWAELRRRGSTECEYRIRHPSSGVRTLKTRGYTLGKTSWIATVTNDVTTAPAPGSTQADKMESVGALAVGIAHDFNNMLMGIAGFASVALKRLGSEHPAYPLVGRITDMTSRGARLIQRLLDFSRKQAPERGPLEIDAMVADCKSLLQTLVGEHIQVVVRTEAPSCRVRADAIELEQVLLNLAANARDAMPRAGVLEVRTEEVRISPDDPRGLAAGRYAMVTVRDCGCGMDAETIERVFDPFFTTKRAGRGTGLGLTNCASIVKRSGGQLLVTSEIGVGTKVSMFLPALPETSDVELTPGQPSAGAVLVVEDDPNVRATIGFYLESLGYEPLIADSAAEAKRLAREEGARIRVLIADIVMPEELGHQIASEIRAEHPDIKVAYMSAHDWDELVREYGVKVEAPLLQKPFDERKLGMLLELLLSL
jgi:two-component system, cell cycle sensor histidine kinase and response regulator CckA